MRYPQIRNHTQVVRFSYFQTRRDSIVNLQQKITMRRLQVFGVLLKFHQPLEVIQLILLTLRVRRMWTALSLVSQAQSILLFPVSQVKLLRQVILFTSRPQTGAGGSVTRIPQQPWGKVKVAVLGS